jgi:hypothetical protein
MAETTENLEFVLLEMRMRTADIVRAGFANSLASAASELGGRILFNIRLDDDEDDQRCAAMLLGPGEADECVALVFLDGFGHSVRVENAAESRHPLAARATQALAELQLS